MVYNDGELVNGCPYYFRVLPPLTKIKSPGMDPCAIGSIVEVLVNSYGMESLARCYQVYILFSFLSLSLRYKSRRNRRNRLVSDWQRSALSGKGERRRSHGYFST